MPKVVNLSRRKPQVVHDGEVYIGHRLNKWANPFKIGRDGTREQVIALYEYFVRSKPELTAALPELRGKDLACWCAPKPCHGDVLLRLVELKAKGEL